MKITNMMKTKALQLKTSVKLERCLTKLMSVNIIVPNLLFPNLSSNIDDPRVDDGKNHPSILAKSRKPRRLNKIDAPSRI